MKNKTTLKNKSTIQYVGYRTYDETKSHRYSNTLLILNSNDRGNMSKAYHSMYSTNTVTISDKDKFFKVTEKEKNRLDLIAKYYYNDAKKYWIIADVNNITNCFDVPVGTILRIPMNIVDLL